MLALAGTGCASARIPARAAPVDAQADARTREQYAWLRATWGRQTIAGQQDLAWNDGHAPAGTSDKDNFWTGDHYNTAAHKTKVYHHPAVITLDRLPAFLKAPT